jgi:hypothetical protein
MILETFLTAFMVTHLVTNGFDGPFNSLAWLRSVAVKLGGSKLISCKYCLGSYACVLAAVVIVMTNGASPYSILPISVAAYGALVFVYHILDYALAFLEVNKIMAGFDPPGEEEDFGAAPE